MVEWILTVFVLLGTGHSNAAAGTSDKPQTTRLAKLSSRVAWEGKKAAQVAASLIGKLA